MPNKTFIIVDIDGTLANVDHRQEFAQTGQWDEFHDLCHLDPPYQDIIDIIDVFADYGGYNVVGLTGRPRNMRPNTMEWLGRHGVMLQDVWMPRGEQDFRSDIELKTTALEAYFGSKEEVLRNVLFMLEDRDRLVAHFRDYGLTVLQPRLGTY